ncbi:MAG: hypothetical protein Q8S17_11250 [Humidesulfovibrio sp.]|nr:hypothetical protein [Humidesulfovibrio sp.]
MTAPVRSESVSPFAAARPMVQSRRVSLRVGSFGLTYSTERLLWDGAQGEVSALANLALADPPPVDAAPAVETERPQGRTESSTFPLDLEAERKRARWATVQKQAETEQAESAAAHSGAVQTGQTQQRSTDRVASNAEMPGAQWPGAAADAADLSAALTDGANAQAGTSEQARQAAQAGRAAALTQAMRQAAQAYQACAASFACPRPMLQAVA